MHQQPTKKDKDKEKTQQFKRVDAEETSRVMAPPPFQMKASAGSEKPSQENSGKSGSLPQELVSGFANTSGHDLSNVDVKYNSSAPSQVGALAYAQGNEIHLGPGQEKHLAHEAAHVVQQREGRVKPTTEVGGKSVNDEQSLESEADQMGAKAIQAKMATPESEGKKGGKESGAVQMKTDTNSAPVQRAMKDKYPWEGVITNSAGANVRASAGKDGEILTALVKGTKVTVTEASGSWLKVSVKQGEKTVTGYIFQTLVEDPTIARLNETVEAVDATMDKMWTDSFNKDKTKVEEQGSAIVEKGGSISATNPVKGGSGSVVIDHTTKKDETLIGDIHTHPYSKSEGSELGVGFSAGDITSMRSLAKQGFQRLVEAGTKRFAMVVTDEAKALKFYKDNTDAKIEKTWNDAFNASKGNFQEAVVEAVYAVLGKGGANGISFYETGDKAKTKFGEVK